MTFWTLLLELNLSFLNCTIYSLAFFIAGTAERNGTVCRGLKGCSSFHNPKLEVVKALKNHVSKAHVSQPHYWLKS
jgi:hypothetical protein